MFGNRKIILLIVLLVVGTLSLYMILIVIPARVAQQSYDGARQIGHDLQQVFKFTPEVKVNNVVVMEQQTEVLELATVSQRFQHEFKWKNTWLNSTKEIDVRGTFDAKAGFDLAQAFEVNIEDNKATLVCPSPQLLSVESLGNISFEDESGVWNWIHEEDRTIAINAFITDARRIAADQGFVEDAGRQFREKTIAILQAHVDEIVFEMGGETYTWTKGGEE